MSSMSQLNEEERNFARFFFLNFKVSPDIARRFFDGVFPPTNLAQTINSNLRAIITLNNRKQISAIQLQILRGVPGTKWSPYHPQMPKGTKAISSKDFDLTLIICLLRNFGGLSKPSNGWDRLPNPSDMLPAAGLATLKWHRNQLAHATVTSMDKNEFTDKWTLVEKALTSLNKGQRPFEVTEILNYDLAGEQAKIIASAELKKLKTEFMDCEKEKEQIESEFCYYREGNLPIKIAEANATFVETWFKDDEHFYETKGSEIVFDKVKHCSCILVTSNSGLGKTATIRHIAFKFKLEGFEIVPIESPEDIIQYMTNKNQVFLIDDVLGKYDLSPTLLEKWERLNEKLISCLESKVCSNKILCTLRLQIEQQKRFRNASTILNKVVINLEHESCALSKEEKQKILIKHLCRSNLENEIKTEEVEIMCETSYAFPLLCKLISNDEERFRKRLEFFRRPLSLLKEELDKISLENKKLYCMLVICMLFKGSFCRNIFDIDSDEFDEKIYRIMQTCGLQRNLSKKELEDSALSAVGLYFTKDSNNFRFIHDALEETIGCHFYKFDPRVMFSDCDILFIRDRIRVISNENTIENINENTVIIREDELDDDRLRPLYDRLWIELKDGRFSSLLMSHLFKNRNFVRIFGITFDKSIHTVLVRVSSEQRHSRDQSVFKQAFKIVSNDQFQVSKDAISRVIEARDVRSTFIDWIVAFGCYEFFRLAWSKMTAFERKLVLGRYGTFLPSVESFFPLAVLGGSLDIVKELISYGADVNCFSEFLETPLYIAVKTGHYDMVRLLLRNRAHVNLRVLFPHFRLKIPIAFNSNKQKLSSLILEYDLHQTNLHKAVRDNDLEKLRRNIRSDNIDSKTKSGLTVLHYAVFLDNLEAVKVLFHEELPKNDDSFLGLTQDSLRQVLCKKPTPKVNIVDNNGLTAVHLAVINNNTDILSLLLRNKAEVKIRDDFYRTPLHYATSESAAKLLLSHNSQNMFLGSNRNADEKRVPANTRISAFRTTCLNITLQTAFEDVVRDFINMPDKEGNTPLHSAIERRFSKQESSDCIETLIENGANPYLFNDMCISAVELMDRCGDTDKYISNNVAYRQSIEKTHKVFASVTFILTALTFILFNYFIYNKGSQNDFVCVGQVAGSGNITLIQVTRRHYVLLTVILIWSLSMITFNMRFSVILWRFCLILVSIGCVSFVLQGELVYILLIKTFGYIGKIVSLIVLYKLYLESEQFITRVTGMQLMHRKRLKKFILILYFFCVFKNMIVSFNFHADDKKYNFTTMRMIFTLNITASNCTELSSVHISCKSLAYNITYKNGVDFSVQCHTDPNITRYNGTLTAESKFTDWSEICIISLFWSNAICTYCFLLCFPISCKRKLITDVTIMQIPFLNGMTLSFFAHLFLYINIHSIVIGFVITM